MRITRSLAHEIGDMLFAASLHVTMGHNEQANEIIRRVMVVMSEHLVEDDAWRRPTDDRIGRVMEHISQAASQPHGPAEDELIDALMLIVDELRLSRHEGDRAA